MIIPGAITFLGHNCASPITVQHPGFSHVSWRKVSVILGAAAKGPAELDDCIQTLGKADLLDSDLTEYVASLVTAEVSEIRGVHLPSAFAARAGD